MSQAQPDYDPKEQAVNNYLTFLHNPDNLVDQSHIDELQDQLQQASSPSERLKIQSEIQRFNNPDEDELLQQFKVHALEWAKEYEISASAFIQEGVSPNVLAQAGFDVDDSRSSSVEEVVGWMHQQSGPFTVQQAMDATGASRNTVRKAVNITNITPIGEHKGEGPGRSATLYEVRYDPSLENVTAQDEDEDMD